MKLTVGTEYKRAKIHDAFGGSRQSGISASRQTDNILVFTGDSGDLYGYSDRWEGDHFHYTGEGQLGDMEFVRGNKAVRDHAEDKKRIRLFEMTRKSFVRYLGEMRCIDYYFFDTPDRNGDNRRAIRFVFEPVGSSSLLPSKGSLPQPGSEGYKKPDKTSRQGLVTSRVGQGWYRRELLRKFNFRCAVTDCDIEEILIASHIVPWAQSTDEERLDVENGIILCPAYDALFDRHLISFSDNGEILLSRSLTEEQCSRIAVDTGLIISVSEGMKPYLERHRAALRQ